MKKGIREKLLVCSLLNVFSAEEMVAIMIALVSEPRLTFEDLLFRGSIWQNYSQARKKMEAVRLALKNETIDGRIEKLKKTGTQFCTIVDEEYPQELKEIYLPPVVIYYHGDLQLTQGNRLGIVGSRLMTDYGRTVIKKIIPDVTEKGIVTVSGLAKGVDQEVHRQTIWSRGSTIGVIGTGLDVSYPAENEKLQVFMRKHHLVISEYPLGVAPKRHHFPMRNRIIAGLSQALLVIEAKEKSGSLITANVALQENKEVLAVPGNILNSAYIGTNRLIQAGAKPILCFDDIAVEMAAIWNLKN